MLNASSYANCVASIYGHASRGCLVNSIGIIEVEGAPRNAVKASIGTRLVTESKVIDQEWWTVKWRVASEC